MKTLITTFAALVGLAICGTAVAQEDITQEFVPDELSDTEILDSGWGTYMAIGLSVNGSNYNNVVGQADGATWTFGVNLDAAAEYLSGNHEWINSLEMLAAFSRTPVIDEFVKSADLLTLQSIYFYHLPNIEWLGPFARFQLDTSMFSSFDVRASENQYTITELDGTVTDGGTSDRFQVTDPFSPLLLRESVGMFARPYETEPLTVDLRVGFGAREVLADNQLVVSDDADTAGIIELTRIDSYNQAGLEGVLELTGQVEGGRISYGASAEAMIPFLNNDDESTPIELTNVELGAGIAFNLVEWASIGYEIRGVRIPQLLDDWQVSNNLLITFTKVLVPDSRATEE